MVLLGVSGATLLTLGGLVVHARTQYGGYRS